MNIFLEGYSFVGKTTLLKSLAKLDPSLVIIDEHDVYAGSIGNYPPFPSPTAEAAVENVDFFYDLEQRRHNDAMVGEGINVFDRSIFSVILFQKYISSLNRPGYASAYEYAKLKASQLIESGKVTVPDAVVYVQATYDTVLERYGREISVDLLRGEVAHSFFSQQYKTIESIYRDHDSVLSITSTNNLSAVDSQAELIDIQLSKWAEVGPNPDSLAIAKGVVEAL